MAVAWNQSDVAPHRSLGGLDTSEWRLDAPSAEGLREQLRAHFSALGGSVANMLQLFHFASPGESYARDVLTIDVDEFVRALRTRCGYVGPEVTLVALFETLDVDVRPRRHPIRARRPCTAHLPPQGCL
jgi:hypothetical protein